MRRKEREGRKAGGTEQEIKEWQEKAGTREHEKNNMRGREGRTREGEKRRRQNGLRCRE